VYYLGGIDGVPVRCEVFRLYLAGFLQCFVVFRCYLCSISAVSRCDLCRISVLCVVIRLYYGAIGVVFRDI